MHWDTQVHEHVMREIVVERVEVLLVVVRHQRDFFSASDGKFKIQLCIPSSIVGLDSRNSTYTAGVQDPFQPG